MTNKTGKSHFLIALFILSIVLVIMIVFQPVSKHRYYYRLYHDPEIQEMFHAYSSFVSEYRMVFGHFPDKQEFLNYSDKVDLLESDLLKNDIVLCHEFIDDDFVVILHNPNYRTMRIPGFIKDIDNNFLKFLISGESVFMYLPSSEDSLCEFCIGLFLVKDGRKIENPELRRRIVPHIENSITYYSSMIEIEEPYYVHCCYDKSENSLSIICEDIENNLKPENLDILFDSVKSGIEKELINEDVDNVYFAISLHRNK